MICAFIRDYKARSGERLNAGNAAWNNDPTKGGWTGFDAIEAQMRAGVHMAEGVCVEPRTAAQYAAYHRLQNLAPQLGFERRPPSPHGLGCVHIHMERSDHGDIDGGLEDVA